MEFTIITLGDLETFRATLTAIAMLFNPSNTTDFVGTSDVGLGGFAAIGLLIALTVALFKGVTTLKFELGELIIVVILYSALFVPKFDVVLEDYYTGQAAAVDDVPLGIALPGAFISGFTTQISETLSTAFKTASSPAFAMQENGFVYPLKLLNGLRNGSQTFAKKQPKISASVINVYKDCAFGRAGFDSGELARSNNPWEFLKGYIQNSSVTGITEIYTRAAPSGTIVTCQEAADLVSTDLDLLFEPGANPNIAPSTQNPNGVSQFEELVCANMKNVRTKNSGCPDYETYETSFHAISAASGESAKNFAMTTMLASSLKNAELCASGAVDASKMATCMPMVTALEQFKEDAVGGATLFQKTMLNSMSVMLFLFYAFAPLVSVLMIALGAKGLKLLGSYFMFGIWTQSWLPFATILNFYIQQKVAYDSARFGVNSPELTAAGYQAFYESVSLNLGIASDLMAATPLITLALLSGSVFALTGVANRLSGRDYYDEKVNAPTAISNGAVAMNTPAFTGSTGKFSALPGDTAAPSITLAKTSAAAASYATQVSRSNSIQAEQSITKSFLESFSKDKSFDKMESIARETGALHSKGYQAALSYIANNESGKSTDQERSAAQARIDALTNATTFGLSANATAGLGIPGAKGVGAGAGVNVGNTTSGTDTNQTTLANTNKDRTSVGNNVNMSGGGSKTSSASINESLAAREQIALAQRVAQKVDSSTSKAESERLTQMATRQEAAINTLTRTDTIGYQANLDAKGLLSLTERSPEFDKTIDDARFNQMSDDGFRKAYLAQYNALRSTDAYSTMDSRGNNIADDYAFLLTLQDRDPAEFVRVMSQAFPGVASSEMGDPAAKMKVVNDGVEKSLGAEPIKSPAPTAASIDGQFKKFPELGSTLQAETAPANPGRPIAPSLGTTTNPEKTIPTVKKVGEQDIAEVKADAQQNIQSTLAAVGANQKFAQNQGMLYQSEASTAISYINNAQDQRAFPAQTQQVMSFLNSVASNPGSIITDTGQTELSNVIKTLDAQQAAATRAQSTYAQSSSEHRILGQYLTTSQALEKTLKDDRINHTSNAPTSPSLKPNLDAGEAIAASKNEAAEERETAAAVKRAAK